MAILHWPLQIMVVCWQVLQKLLIANSFCGKKFDNYPMHPYYVKVEIISSGHLKVAIRTDLEPVKQFYQLAPCLISLPLECLLYR